MKRKSWMSFAVLIFLLAIIGCGGDSNGSSSGSGSLSIPGINIFTPVNYDTGITPVVAGVENSNIIIEMHQSSGGGAFYYHVATVDVDNNTVNWGPSHIAFGGGLNPSIAVSEGGVVAEAHEESDINGDAGDGNIVTTIGIASIPDNQIYWGSGQKLGTSYKPAICITRDGKTVVLIYQNKEPGTYINHLVTLYYRVGNVDAVNKTVSWGPAVAYDAGIYPSISINNLGHIITVHSSWQSNDALWSKVGQLNANNTVNWGPTVSFNEGAVGASVSISDDPGDGTGSNLMLVYPGRKNDGALWLSIGSLSPGSTTADWIENICYGRSSPEVSPACTYAYNHFMVEVHDSGLSGKLWYGLTQF